MEKGTSKMIHRCGRCDFGVAREDGSCDGGCDSEEEVMETIYVIIESRDFSLPYGFDRMDLVPICWVRTEKEAEDKIWELTQAEAERSTRWRPELHPRLSWDWEVVPKG